MTTRIGESVRRERAFSTPKEYDTACKALEAALNIFKKQGESDGSNRMAVIGAQFQLSGIVRSLEGTLHETQHKTLLATADALLYSN